MCKAREQNTLVLPWKEEQGICIVICGFFLLGIIAVVGLVTDAGKLFVDGLCTQLASDAGALAGAAHIGGLTGPQVEALAAAVARDNLDMNRVPYDPADISAALVDQRITVNATGRSETAIIGNLFGGSLNWSLARKAVGERRPVAIAVVADTSGSMLYRSTGGDDTPGPYPGSRLEALVVAGKTFLNAADPTQDAVAIVRFDTDAEIVYPMTYQFSREDINNAMTELRAGDWTNINAGIKAGIGEILKLRTMTDADGNPLDYDAFVKIVLLITDGVPNKFEVASASGDPDPVPYPRRCPGTDWKKDFLWPVLRADFARDNGILVYTVGLGDPDTNAAKWYQGGESDQGLKTFFMRRMANDYQAGAFDPPFPRCITPYGDLLNKPMAKYQSSASGDDLLRMFNRIYRVTLMRLVG